MPDPQPDHTAVRTALWRALHLEVDAPPPVIADGVGLRLAGPDEGWRDRPDMQPDMTRLFRASILARARFVEDLVADEAGRGLGQYVILGAGLDSFAQRRPELTASLTVFEIDRPAPQAFKRRRLVELGYGVPDGLKLVPVDFEAAEDWIRRLEDAGFDPARPAVVASAGVSMYLSREAVRASLEQVAALASGTILAMTFLVPIELADPQVRPGLEISARGAAAGGTPFLSYFAPDEILALAREAGFRQVRHVSGAELGRRYFEGRSDGLRPPSSGEDLLVATV